MSQYPKAIQSAVQAILDNGVGSCGTRNIGGNNRAVIELEQEALVFTSGHVSNDASLTSPPKIIPGLIYFSDEFNHAFMTACLRNSRREKYLHKHLYIVHLEQILDSVDISKPKMIVFESYYSMDGL